MSPVLGRIVLQPAGSRMFFSFDGVDGVGKSTQVTLFCDWLRGQGHQVVLCRDPGSTRLGESIREILLGTSETPIHCRAEMLLYMAARAQLVEEVIRPALDDGKTVVSDRFLLANVVYQGYAGGLPVEDLWQVGQVTVEGVLPTFTFLLDMEPQHASERLQRSLDRMESRGLEFLTRVRDGFLAEAAKQPESIAIINADQPIDQVQEEIRAAAASLLD
jgi:dTMP kinase